MQCEFEKRLWLFCRTVHKACEQLFLPLMLAEDVTLPQMRVLFAVLEQEHISVGELSELTRMNGGNCSTMCKKLEQKGLIRRRRSRQDERIVLLELEPAGRQLLERILQKAADCQSPVFARLTSEEQERIHICMDTIEQYLQAILLSQAAADERS